MDAHANEYMAAAEGMAETYGRIPPPLPESGDYVTGITAGKRWGGVVMSAQPGRLAIECSGAWIVVPPEDVLTIERRGMA